MPGGPVGSGCGMGSASVFAPPFHSVPPTQPPLFLGLPCSQDSWLPGTVLGCLPHGVSPKIHAMECGVCGVCVWGRVGRGRGPPFTPNLAHQRSPLAGGCPTPRGRAVSQVGPLPMGSDGVRRAGSDARRPMGSGCGMGNASLPPRFTAFHRLNPPFFRDCRVVRTPGYLGPCLVVAHSAWGQRSTP